MSRRRNRRRTFAPTTRAPMTSAVARIVCRVQSTSPKYTAFHTQLRHRVGSQPDEERLQAPPLGDEFSAAVQRTRVTTGMSPRLQSNLGDLRWRDDDRLGYTRRQSRNNGCNEGRRIIIAKTTLLLVVVPFPSCSCIFDDDRRYLRTVPHVPIHGRRFRHHPYNFRYES